MAPNLRGNLPAEPQQGLRMMKDEKDAGIPQIDTASSIPVLEPTYCYQPIYWTPVIVVQTHYESDVFDSITKKVGDTTLSAWSGSHIDVDTYYAKTPWGMVSHTTWHMSEFEGFSISAPDLYVSAGHSESHSGFSLHQEEPGFNWPVLLAPQQGGDPEPMASSPSPLAPAGNIVTDAGHVEHHMNDWSVVQIGPNWSYASSSTDVYLDEFHQRGPGHQIDSWGSVVNNYSHLSIGGPDGYVTMEHSDHTAQSSTTVVQQAMFSPYYYELG
jgi:hypothetical protein